jgi:amphi-Trp domain-containing protein
MNTGKGFIIPEKRRNKMSGSNEDFKFESLQDRQSIAKYLQALNEGFLSGKIMLGSREKQILFEPSGLLRMEVKAKRKSSRVKLSIKCSWHEDAGVKESRSEKLVIESRKQG